MRACSKRTIFNVCVCVINMKSNLSARRRRKPAMVLFVRAAVLRWPRYYFDSSAIERYYTNKIVRDLPLRGDIYARALSYLCQFSLIAASCKTRVIGQNLV